MTGRRRSRDERNNAAPVFFNAKAKGEGNGPDTGESFGSFRFDLFGHVRAGRRDLRKPKRANPVRCRTRARQQPKRKTR